MINKSTKVRSGGLVIILALIVLYGVAAYTAVLTKSPTADELNHTFVAYLQVFARDFRMAPEVPPAWNYIAAIPMAFNPPIIPQNEIFERAMDVPLLSWDWAYQAGYQTPGNNPLHLVNDSRVATLSFAIALAILIARWSSLLCGVWAACLAVALFAFDPNFLGHGPLVKNDVAFAMAWLWVLYATWQLGLAWSWWRVLNIAAAVAVCIGVKPTGVIAIPLVGILLLIRSLLRIPQSQSFTRELKGRGRLAFVIVPLIACCLFTYVMIWAVYGFRYAPTPDSSKLLSRDFSYQRLFQKMYFEEHGGRAPSAADFQAWRPPVSTQLLLWLNDQRLIPNAFGEGMLKAQQEILVRPGYVLGETNVGGDYRYFAVAFLAKTPIATLVSFGIAMVLLVRWIRDRSRKLEPVDPHAAPADWTLLCLLVPTVAYFAIATTSKINIGFRHLFPVYPPLFIATAFLITHFIRSLPPARAKWAAGFTVLISLGLAVESWASRPNYIAFFNAAAGGSRGGLYILPDNCLDWGQDLLELKKWRDSHPDGKLYLAYWANHDPRFYGIDYIPVTVNTSPKRVTEDIDQINEPGYVAISASVLQAYFLPPAKAMKMQQWQKRKPIAVLGGTLYIFETGKTESRE